jgi:hypothetical protein
MWTTGYIIFLHIYAAFEPSHRCFIPSCDFENSTLHENHTDFSIPVEHATGNLFKSADKFDPCQRFAFTDEFAAKLSQLSSPLLSDPNNGITCSKEHFNTVS